MQRDFSLVDDIIERWPTTTRIVFGVRAKQVLMTDDTLVHPLLVVLVVTPCKGQRESCRLLYNIDNLFFEGKPVKGRSVPASCVT